MRAGLVIAGKYRLVRELGAGGMGSVWQAVHLVTEREFAIKFLHASCAASGSLLARFFQEARVSGKLRHPSVIEIFDVGTAPELAGAPFLVMELLDGASLDVLVQQLGPLPPRMVLETIADSARALALAHDKGIVHRDLKPANIFLHRPGTGALVPKVLDFGISKMASRSGPDVITAGLTDTGTVLGSPLYMSPEQAASDKTIDGRSDIHALGVVLWECLVGAAPFLSDTYNVLVVQIITGERPRLHDVMPSAPPEVAAIVERAMARRREERFQSAAEFADALEAVIPGIPGTSLLARTSAVELFSRIKHPSLRPPASSEGERARSTTGGVAVPSVRDVRPASPAAMTVDAPTGPRRHSATAFDDTHPAIPSKVSETFAETVNEAPAARAVAPGATTTSSRSRAVPWALGAGGGLVLIAAAVANTLAAPHRSAAPAASLGPEPPSSTFHGAGVCGTPARHPGDPVRVRRVTCGDDRHGAHALAHGRDRRVRHPAGRLRRPTCGEGQHEAFEGQRGVLRLLALRPGSGQLPSPL